MDEGLLVAYVDGALDTAERARVERALAHDPKARAFVERLQRLDLPIAEAFDDVLERRVPVEMAERILAGGDLRGLPRNALRRRWGLAAAAILLAFSTGLSVGLLWDRESIIADSALPQHYAWVTPIAQLQKLYVPSALAQSIVSDEEIGQLGDQLGRWLGLDLRVPDLTPFGLVLSRGQALEVMEKPVAQLLYLSDQGEPLSFSIVPMEAPDEAPATAEAEGLPLVHWQQDGFAFALIGDIDADSLKDLTEQLRRRDAS